jgi:hypothetical protein
MIKKILLISCLFFNACILHASSISVSTTNDSGPGSLRQAITDALDGDTINIALSGTITLISELPIITKIITINGYVDVTTISGNNSCRIFTIQIPTGTVTLNRLNIINGYSTFGAAAGLYAITGNDGLVALNKCTFSGCNTSGSEAYGGAIATSADINMTNCTIYGDTAMISGGAIATLSDCRVTLLNCTIYKNHSTYGTGTGGLDITGNAIVNIQNTILAGNTAGKTNTYQDLLTSNGGSLNSLGNNMSNTTPFSHISDSTGKDLTAEIRLSDLAPDAWGMLVCALQDGSEAINSANSSAAPVTDQCGNARINAADMGAFENQSPQSAIVTTQAVSNIGTTSANGNGNITGLGYPNPTAHGFCWNTTGTPIVSDSNIDLGAAVSTGVYSASLKGLTEGITYFLRAYAINTVSTSYGDEVSFTTHFYNLTVSDTTILGYESACFGAENNLTVAGIGTPVTIENKALANFIAGQSVTFLPGFHAESGSLVHSWITTDGTYCDGAGPAIVMSPPEEKSLALEETGKKSVIEDKIQVKVYPNPSNGKFTLSITGAHETQSDIRVYNLLGRIVFKGRINQASAAIAIDNAFKGLYILNVTTGKESFSRKIIIQ